MANILTGFRIICSIILLFVPTFSVQFYLLYIIAGITDVLDGMIARKSDTVSKFGSTFDSIADICFVGVCFIKLIPVLDMPVWLCIWVAVIILIKIVNITFAFAIHKSMVAEHTVMNKIVGILLFLFPFLLSIIDFRSFTFVCSALATFSAMQEGWYIKKGKIIY